MTPELPDLDRRIQADIEELRAKFPQTQDLYREVCVLLFFRYGIAPTANKLYQLVRKGSMNAPAEALARFWENLREKSRVRIEHPCLPDDLKSAAGDLVVALWGKAQGQAQESLASLRGEAQGSVVEAKAAQAAAEIARTKAVEGLGQATARIDELSAQLRSAEQHLAAEAATRAALDAQLAQANESVAESRRAIEHARRDFAAELAKLHDANQVIEERHQAAETRALLEIDRERMVASKVQKELESMRASVAETAERHRLESKSLQGQIGEARQRIGALEGQFGAVDAARIELAADLAAERKAVRELGAELSSARIEAGTWQAQALSAQREIQRLQPAKPRKARRRPVASDTSPE